jgi:hypothetical protein
MVRKGAQESEVERAIGHIQQQPQLFPQHNELGMRKYVIRRFPYTIMVDLRVES